ncbi:DNA (cytosine-5-)-methyltransferase [Mediterranea massiliensis]|uniref:DNA (cytosine-5-)-methyltransferase n=1 Tax=Mediterranea massiliensis TaxID=1841865 RepID=UPI0025A33DE3|nr:DNA (cytosine-5-)-methyltransferase [Mediterranea massiliensis]MDM8337306.1 DNA (cytosine-5-)-methyltransferase [Mediterranea massiliensis]
MGTFLSTSNLADILGVSLATAQKWRKTGTYPPRTDDKGREGFYMEDLIGIPPIRAMLKTNWAEEYNVTPIRDFTSIELFAGGGGLALGMEKAGFKHVLLNEFDTYACQTLRLNRPEWNVVEGDVSDVDFTPWHGKVDFISGGFPCQAFSYAGKKGGLNDTRGTLFFQLARAVSEIQPKVFMGENVKGLLSHEDGRTLDIIKNTIHELGYTLVEPRVLKAIMYQVPQKRERLILVAIRNDYAEQVRFEWPSPYNRVMTLNDAFRAGELFDTDVPLSPGQTYPEGKRKVMELVPEGGDWRNLPVEVQKQYMGGSFYLGGGKTGMARRLSMDEPSLTLTCAPAQKQTERCHPLETRPLTVREYARIQTFPDEWQFAGTLSAQYKQIGNAVPVNLAWAVGRSIMRLMNQIERIDRGERLNMFNMSDMSEVCEHKAQYHTSQKKVIQLSLFEPLSLYLSKNDPAMLVGSCRQGTKEWITTQLMYNYPITSEELEEHPELSQVKHLIVLHRKTLVGYFNVTGMKIVDRNYLQGQNYPVKSSKHKSGTQYLLYTLERNTDEYPDIDFNNFKILIGKGVK